MGVPSTAKHRGRISRIRSGRWIEIAWEAALCCDSGATTHTSPAPIRPDADGKYPVPQPGILKDREYKESA